MGQGAGSQSVGLIAALVAAVVLQPAACGGGGESENKALDRAIDAMLADFWPEVVEPSLGEAAAAAAELEAATAAWSAAEIAGEGLAEREVAQLAWFEAMAAWQRVELLQVGPAASSLQAVGGLDLRDAIYSWPTVNPCRVDQETVEGAFTAPDFFEVELVNVTGLDALETVLFSADDANDCPPQVAINADGTWAALGPDGVRQARAAYAEALAKQVSAEVAAIEAAWVGGFADDFAEAEASGVYESRESALNAVYDALFYLETATKDRKLGEPLGLRDCGATDCLQGVETPLSGGSELWIRENLAGFRLAFTGGEGAGVDDVLIAVDEGELVDAMLAALDGADAAAAKLQTPVDAAAQGDPTDALALHAALGEVSDLLRSDVAAVLLLQVPDEAAGDND